MNTDRLALAGAAENLVGVPFRLHGRDPLNGLDCVGLVAAALAMIGRPAPAPSGYRLRNREISNQLTFASSAGFAPASDAIQPGDLLLVSPGPLQHHLLFAGLLGNFIHAHAGLRRVVSAPGPLAHPVLRHWRLLDPE